MRKINIGVLRDLDISMSDLLDAMKEYGLKDDGSGILDPIIPQNSNNKCVAAILVLAKFQNVRKVNKDTGKIESVSVTKHETIPFHIYEPDGDGRAVLETFDGSIGTIDKVVEFVIDCLGIPTSLIEVEVDLSNIVNDLQDTFEGVMFKSASIKNYEPVSDAKGTFGPKFTDTSTASNIITQNIDNVKHVTVKFKIEKRTGIIRATADGSFSFKCVDKDDLEVINAIRSLAGVPYRGWLSTFLRD